MSSDPSPAPQGARQRQFATTEWSVVLAIGEGNEQQSRAALARLCEAYWYPVYVYVRRKTDSPHESQDLTQAFFSQLIEKQTLAKADPSRGRFRAFLLTALKNFLANEWEKARRQKRGGGKVELSLDFDSGESRFRIEPAHHLTPEKLFERRWVLTLLDQVLERLRGELVTIGKAEHFEHFKATLAGAALSDDDYQRAAAALALTPAAAKQAAYRLRQRYRELFRAEVARTVASDEEVDDEIGRLLQHLAEN